MWFFFWVNIVNKVPPSESNFDWLHFASVTGKNSNVSSYTSDYSNLPWLLSTWNLVHIFSPANREVELYCLVTCQNWNGYFDDSSKDPPFCLSYLRVLCPASLADTRLELPCGALGHPRIHPKALDRGAVPVVCSWRWRRSCSQTQGRVEVHPVVLSVAAIIGATWGAEAVCGGAAKHVPTARALMLLGVTLLLWRLRGEARRSEPLSRWGDGLGFNVDVVAGVDGEVGALR